MRLTRIEDSREKVHTVCQTAAGYEIVTGDWSAGWKATGVNAVASRQLAPVIPPQIFCIGLNYRKHAEETKAALPEYPVVFMKGVNALLAPGQAIRLPRGLASHKVDYECELAVVIGKTARNVPREKALEHVAGYTAANDVSARDWQKGGGGGQWVRGKTFDTFCPLGPVVVTADELPDASNLRITTAVNGEILQDSFTNDLIFKIPEIIEFLSGSTTLFPGSVILTGTPSGVGVARTPPRFLKAGDQVVVEIEKIGQLVNPVAEESASALSQWKTPG